MSQVPRGVEVAGLGKRFLAAIIDALPLTVLGGGWYLVMDARPSATVLLVAGIAVALLAAGYGLVQWWAYGTRGAGLGFRAPGLCLVGLSDGAPIGWWRWFLRNLVVNALWATGIGGVALLVFLVVHERRQGWHDLAVGSLAVQPKMAEARASAQSAKRSPSVTTVGLPPHLSHGFAPRAGSSATSTGSLDPSAFAPTGSTSLSSTPPAPSWMRQLETIPLEQTLSPMTPMPPASAPSAVPPPPVTPTPGFEQARMPSPETSLPPVAPPAPVQPTQPSNQGWIQLQSASSIIAPVPSPAPKVVPRTFGEVEHEDGDSTRIAPAIATQQRDGAEGWYIRLDDNREVELTAPVLLGRNPRKSEGDPEVQLVPASGDGRMISRTHVSVAADAQGVHVIDRGSTNGTALVGQNGALEPCPSGVSMRVREGQQVSYGNRWFTVLRRPVVAG